MFTGKQSTGNSSLTINPKSINVFIGGFFLMLLMAGDLERRLLRVASRKNGK